MRIIAIEKFDYGHRTRQPGEEFDADDMHGKLLIQRGIARAKADNPQPAKLMTTQITPELVPPAQPSKRTYKRRDLRAED